MQVFSLAFSSHRHCLCERIKSEQLKEPGMFYKIEYNPEFDNRKIIQQQQPHQ